MPVKARSGGEWWRGAESFLTQKLLLLTYLSRGKSPIRESNLPPAHSPTLAAR